MGVTMKVGYRVLAATFVIACAAVAQAETKPQISISTKAVEVTVTVDPALRKFAGLFEDLVAGTSKDGKAFRPMLMARDKRIGKLVQERNRKELASIYAGMDPRNVNTLSGKYTDRVDEQGLSAGKFQGDGWRIKIR